MPVQYDNAAAGSLSFSVTSVATPGFTISGANRLGLAVLFSTSALTVTTATIGGQSASLLHSMSGSGSFAYVYGAVAPSVGAGQTASFSWSGAANAVCAAVSLTGASQTITDHGGNNSAYGYASSFPLAVTSVPGDLTVTFWIGNGGGAGTSDQTQVVTTTYVGADYGPGTGTTTHTWTAATQTAAVLGINVVAAAGGIVLPARLPRAASLGTGVR